MVRRWIAFDSKTINGEFLELPAHDRRALKYAMENYKLDTGANYVLKDYGDGLLMIRDHSRGSGRCLFFSVKNNDAGEEVLTALLVYKKESDEAPQRVLKAARNRMRESR